MSRSSRLYRDERAGIAGRVVLSEWKGTTQFQGKYYWGVRPVAYYSGGATHFEHQDWLGTERMRTTYNGGVESAYISQPWGDGQASTGSDGNANHYSAPAASSTAWLAV